MSASNLDSNSVDLDPQFTSISGNNYIPTNSSINNLGASMGVVTDIDGNTRSSSNPDIGAHEFLSPVCAGSPSVTSVLTPTYAICPGNDVSIALSDYFSDLGITYQWRASTSSSVGPFTNITGATQPMLSVSNVTATTWYSPVITCTNSSQFISPVGMVQVAGTTTSSVPYLEDFENVAGFDKLPNCSWSVPDLGNSAYIYTQPNTQDRIPYSGSNFASAYYSPNSSKYFFTNGIQLNAGVVYSASVMYITNYSGSTNWDLEIMIGSSQSTTALSTIAAAAPAVAPAYNSLSNTFTVASSGLYYIAVNATSNGSGSSYLSWDDLRIDIPCEVNSPTVSVSASQASVCSGQSVAITALGADSYTWNNGAYTGSVISVTPYSTTGYTVTGTNDASGCSTSAVQVIMVRPSPMISAFASSPNVCSGTQVNLMAVGANSYSWSTGNNGSSTVVTPVTTGNATTASYTVLGTNAEGCSGQAVATITVNPAPSISVQAPLSICVGESVDATANGATSYNWMSSSSFLSGNPVTLSPMASTSYTVEGTDANGCTGSYVFSLGVDECTGIAANQLSSLRIFPNPTNGGVTLSNIVTGANVRVTDIAGRTMLEATAGAQELSVDLSRLASGIYYVRVSHAGGTDIARIIKN